MATIILQAAGAFLGGFLGPIGTAIGTAAGALGGYVLDRAWMGGSQTIEGPRLEGARPFTAEEGASLPRVYGAARIGGTMIWATRFEERKTVRREGAKGGGPKTTEYSYFGSAAFALCEGEIAGVRRIWADGQEVDREKIELRVYRGTEDQPVDPLIAVKQGAGNAPAYRGTAYVVIERLPLDTYGNRMPQFQFEVIRPLPGIEQDIRAVALIPGSTEYGLATTQVDRESRPGEAQALNRHVLHAASDLDASLDELELICPRLMNVALVVTWYGDDLRAGDCRIRPAVADRGGGTFSSGWRVSGVTRAGAAVVSMHEGGSAFGGTPSDASVVEAIAAIKARGWGVTLYPFVMMDVPAGNALPDPYGGASQAAYPWRGRITCHPGPGQPGSADKTAAARAQVEAFCGAADSGDFRRRGDTVDYDGPAQEWGYRRLILHYAHLAAAAGGVDGFLLGSELRGLTTLRDGAGAFPFVEQLCTLAEDVRGIVGAATRITYGADWSEYFGHHPADGSGDALFHLDPLWAHPQIDAVGIDNYMPLSDWRDGDIAGGNPDGFASAGDLDGLRAQVAGGEGFDWHYAGPADRAARLRTPITDGAYGKPWTFRYKDLVGWWSNRHHDRIGGVEQAAPTAWTPAAKPIWFTEIGCPAVDKGPNQPNVFADPKSAESALPYFSTGERSDFAQRRYLRASLDHWDPESGAFEPAGNPVSPVYGGRMVDPERIYAWAWDARPFPAFPLRSDVWSDGANWHLGHWLNGRLGGVEVGALINAILADHGLPPADAVRVAGTVHGYLVADPTTARAALEPLVGLLGLDARETAAGLVFGDGDTAAAATRLDELVAVDGEAVVEAVRTPAHDIPAQAILAFRDPMRDYQAATARLRRAGGAGSRQESFNFPGTLEAGLADGLLERRLADMWLDRARRIFAVPAATPGTEPGDRIEAAALGGPHLVLEAEEGLVRRVTARPVREPLPLNWPASLPVPAKPALAAGRPFVQLLDLPMISGAAAHQQFRIAAWQRPWRSQAVHASPERTGFELRATVRQAANAGRLVQALGAGFEGRIDHAAAVTVELFDGEAASVSRLQMLNGANALAVLAANGAWEIVQFETAEEIAAGRWRLARLLRGQLGTSDAMAAGAPPDSPAILLDDAVVPAGLRPGETGLTLNWRVGPVGDILSQQRVTEVAAAGGVRALLPLSPAHLRCRVEADGSRRFDWIRRSRIDADGWDGADIPLGEESELYRVEVAAGSGPAVRTATVTAPGWTYAAAAYAADFPTPPAALRVSVRQIGTGGRPGLPAHRDLT